MDDRQLRAVLIHARERGYLGPGDPAAHLDHALGFVQVAERELGTPPARFVDLGTGGGVPGLVLAVAWPEAEGVLTESSQRRATSLREWVVQLDLADRVVVAETRAEVLAHDPDHRERADLVSARGFGPPAATAEIGTALVRLGGVLVVSEPPGGDSSRWPPDELAKLGLGVASLHISHEAAFAAIPKIGLVHNSVPRPRNNPWKRPRWRCST